MSDVRRYKLHTHTITDSIDLPASTVVVLAADHDAAIAGATKRERGLESKLSCDATYPDSCGECFECTKAKLASVEADCAALGNKVRSLTKFYDDHVGTPCEQIRWQQEKDALLEQLAQAQGEVERLKSSWERHRIRERYMADLVFEQIKHGDEKHQAWLKDKLIEIYTLDGQKPQETLDQLRADLAAAREAHKRCELALQSLTPGGSEYVNDPEACVAFIRKVRNHQFDVIKKFKQDRDRLAGAFRDLPWEAVWRLRDANNTDLKGDARTVADALAAAVTTGDKGVRE